MTINNLLKISVFLLFFPSCIHKNRKDHIHELASHFHKDFTNSLNSIEKQVSLLNDRFFNDKTQRKKCTKNYLHNKTSSIYIPKSATRGKSLDCFLESALSLEKLLKKFRTRYDYVSWQYIYNIPTKGFLSYPYTLTDIIFGDDLDFSKFQFFKGASKNYPSGGWSEIKEDIGGTGKILIYSQGIKKKESFTVFAIDLKTKYFLKRYKKKIINILVSSNIYTQIFVYIYQKNKTREEVFKFSSNEKFWSIFNTKYYTAIETNNSDSNKLKKIEKKLNDNHFKILNEEIDFSGSKFDCSIITSTRTNIYAYFCGR